MGGGSSTTSPSTSKPKAPEHLNSTGLRIEYAEGKGRGVYGERPPTTMQIRLPDTIQYLAACHEIPAQTLIEVSPVLLFSAQEYAEHGKHTVLDHYTFVWRDGRMALALGLGASPIRISRHVRAHLRRRTPLPPRARPRVLADGQARCSTTRSAQTCRTRSTRRRSRSAT